MTFKGMARDGRPMSVKIEEVIRLWSTGFETERSIGRKTNLDKRTVRKILTTYLPPAVHP